MSNEVKKYHWFYEDNNYTLEEYLNKVEELISSATVQMQELDGDLLMSEYQKLLEGSAKLSYLNEQLKENSNL
tara:strand:+ start:888 stop:1106 length:219 start_codon:yes stop_codon:yes gene_type:complete